MKATTKVLCAAALAAGVVTAAPQSISGNRAEPCALISDKIAQAIRANSSSLGLDAETAHNCLLSLPFDSQRSVLLIDELAKHIQFQSNLETLKNPPSTYLSEPTDILGGLSNIQTKAGQNGYSSQYEFDRDVSQLLTSAHDGHLSARLCTSGIFSFINPLTLFSFSEDGLQAPTIYRATDVFNSVDTNASVSSIDTINGQNATAFLEAFSSDTTYQDPDTRYNSLFGSFANVDAASQGGRFSSNNGAWPGFANLTLGHANGTTAVLNVRVGLISPSDPADFNFTSGAEVFEYYCIPQTTTTTEEPTTPSNTSTPTTPTNGPTATAGPFRYPVPVYRNEYNLISGYYLEQDYNDTAVLFVPTFGVTGSAPNGGALPNDTIASFAELASTFVKKAKADGKTKIIIDISTNPGGTTIAGFNLFKLFFPEEEIYMANRYRDHTAEKYMLKAYREFVDDYGQSLAFSSQTPRHWAWQGQVDPDGSSTNFTSWEDWYGPETLSDGSQLTLPTNFNNFSAISDDIGPIQGYGPVPLNFTTSPFQGSDIIIMGDGLCGSTCPIFINLMRQRGSGDIRTVVFGGRPNGQPMQIMGDTRGSELYSFDILARQAGNIFDYAVNRTVVDRKPVLNEYEINEFNRTRPQNPNTFPLVVSGGGVNLRNNYNEDDLDLALHFAYEAADCRLYFTAENILNPQSQWYAAAEAIWGGKPCVATSTPTTGDGNGYGNNGDNDTVSTPTPTPTPSNPSIGQPYPGSAVGLGVNAYMVLMVSMAAIMMSL